MTSISFVVAGDPGPQGSKRALGPGRMVEMSKKVKPWREAVKWAALEELRKRDPWKRLDGPVLLSVTFWLPRPKSQYRTGRNAHLLRPDAPRYKISAPDLSKLIRSTEDAITESGLWRDDALVARIVADKRYHDSFMGADITVSTLAVTY